MCACNGSSGAPAESFVVTRSNGTQTEFTDKIQAEVARSASGGTITVKKK
jgi:hypothetical protein